MTALLGILVEIPGMKLESLNVTFRGAHAGSHYARAARAKMQRRTAHAFMLAHLRLQKMQLPAVVTITRVAPGTLDDDNLAGACKHTRDGIADALGLDDRDARLSWRYAQQKSKRGVYAVLVHVSHLASERRTA